MLIADTLKLDQAFALVSPRRVAQVLRQDRMDAYAMVTELNSVTRHPRSGGQAGPRLAGRVLAGGPPL